MFLRNLLLNEKNELHNRLLETGKVDIEEQKVDIQEEKVDIESLLLSKGKNFSGKTNIHVHRMFDRYGFDKVFGRSAVVELLELQNSSVSKLISKLLQAGIIEPISGHGKGKYRCLGYPKQ